MDPILHFTSVLAVNATIFFLAWRERVFDRWGLAAAVSVGFIIGWCGDLSWLALLLLFLFTGFFATRYKFALKEKMGVQEGKKGERGWANVMATGLVPSVIALLSWQVPFTELGPVISKEVGALAFIAAIAVAASDTLASEIGVLYEKTYLITTLEPVKAGTDGGVSVQGEFWALVAAGYAAGAGYIFLTLFAGGTPYPAYLWIIPMFAGFVGCQIDSLMGATIEGKFFFGKHSVNLTSIGLGALLAWVMIP